MKKIIFTLFSVLISLLTFSQTYTFERRVNSDFYRLKIFKNIYDNYNYLYKQTAIGSAPGYLDLVKVDTAGNILNNIALDFQISFIESVLPMSDGFLIAASTIISNSEYVPQLIRINNQGNVKWANQYNNSGPNLLSKPVIINESTNEIYLTGSTFPQSLGTHSFYISRIDTAGNVLGTNVYSHNGNTNTDMIIPTDLFKLTNGNYFLVTYLHEPCVPCQTPMVLLLDSSLNVLSANLLYTFQSLAAGFKFIKKPDDGFYLVGTFDPSPNNLPYGFIINLSPNLTPIWTKYTTNDVSTYGISLSDAHILQNNSLMVAGNYYYAPTNRNVLIMHVDTTGNILWNKNSGPVARDDEFSSWVKDTDAIYVAGSSTDVFNPVTTQGMFMKIDLNGNTTCGNTWGLESTLDFNIMFQSTVITQTSKNVIKSNITTSPVSGMTFNLICSGTVITSLNNTENSGKLNLFPNPAVNELIIENLEQPEEILLFNVWGSVCLHQITSAGDNSIKIDLTGLHNGIYFLEIKTKSGGVVEKFVVNR